MRDSDEAAHIETRQVWVDRFGRNFGDANNAGAESTARYSGCTHEICRKCGKVIERGSWCRDCRHLKDIEDWKKAPRVEWDGVTPLYSDAKDKYLFNTSPEEFAEDEECSIDDLRLYVCEPVLGRPIDSDYFCDELPDDDEEVPDGIYEAMVALNKAIEAHGPLSWTQGKNVPSFGKDTQ